MHGRGRRRPSYASMAAPMVACMSACAWFSMESERTCKHVNKRTGAWANTWAHRHRCMGAQAQARAHVRMHGHTHR
eukprot:355562-Chlamydomonas_euryale.AAC.4